MSLYLAKLKQFGHGIGNYTDTLTNENIPRFGDLYVIRIDNQDDDYCTVVYGPMKRPDGSEIPGDFVDRSLFGVLLKLPDSIEN